MFSFAQKIDLCRIARLFFRCMVVQLHILDRKDATDSPPPGRKIRLYPADCPLSDPCIPFDPDKTGKRASKDYAYYFPCNSFFFDFAFC